MATDTEDVDLYVKMFRGYKPGESCFIEGGKRADYEYIRKHFTAAGLGVEFREVACDVKYKKPGLRIYRREITA